MLSSDRGRRRPRHRLGPAVIVAIAGALLLSACTMQPVYGPGAAGGSVAKTLRSIDIEPADTRVAQEVRNKLIFQLAGGAAVVDPQYRMKLRTTTAESALGITREGSAPVYSVTVTVSYTLIENSTGEIVMRETSRGTASYDQYSQNFANIRAKLDAENRAAAQVADEIRIRVAAATAVGL